MTALSDRSLTDGGATCAEIGRSPVTIGLTGSCRLSNEVTSPLPGSHRPRRRRRPRTSTPTVMCAAQTRLRRPSRRSRHEETHPATFPAGCLAYQVASATVPRILFKLDIPRPVPDKLLKLSSSWENAFLLTYLIHPTFCKVT